MLSLVVRWWSSEELSFRAATGHTVAYSCANENHGQDATCETAAALSRLRDDYMSQS